MIYIPLIVLGVLLTLSSAALCAGFIIAPVLTTLVILASAGVSTLAYAVARYRHNRYLPKARVVSLLLLAGCSSGPLYGIEVAHTNELPLQRDMITLVADAYQVDLDPPIYWTSSPCEGKTAVIWRDTCYHGLTFPTADGGCSEIFVAERAWVGDSALVHELAHCARMELYGDGDPTHSDTWWWAIAEAIDKHLDQLGGE